MKCLLVVNTLFLYHSLTFYLRALDKAVILECAKAFPKLNHMKGYANDFVIIRAALTFPTVVLKLAIVQ